MSITTGTERRREDYGPITGLSNYVDDLRPPPGRPPVLQMVVVRSLYAHARIKSVQLNAAKALPGVLAAFEGAELVQNMPSLDVLPVPGLHNPGRQPMAIGKVRFVGDPVAIILAENLYTAIDSRDLVDIEYEQLPAVSDPEAGIALNSGAPLLYPELGSNIAFEHATKSGDVTTFFEKADHKIQLRLVNSRLAPSSIEPRACMFDYDAESGKLTAWLSSQAIYRARETLAKFLGLDRRNIRVYNADVGGAFGAKSNFLGEEIIAARLAMQLGRPVKWIESRIENLQSLTHGRGQITYVEAAFENDGKLLALRVRIIADLGAYLAAATAMVPNRIPSMLCGPYQLQALESQVIGVFTNKVPTAPYRGAGRPEAAYILERTIDRIAHELSLDPAEVRLRNFIPASAFPHTTVTGVVYDSGNYEAALHKALEMSHYTEWRAKQRQSRAETSTKLLGIGLSTFIELSGDAISPAGNMPREAAIVRILQNGSILVQSGVSHTGQGHFTALAQIVAATFQMPAESIEVRMNDTALPVFSIGTFSSRITQIAGSAVLLAAEAVRDKVLQVAARKLEAAPADLEVADGYVRVRGVPARSVTLGALAQLVEAQPELLEQEPVQAPHGTALAGLAAKREFSPPGATYASGAHVVVIEIDAETGEVKVLSYVAVDDCGRVLNAHLAEAQIHGSLTQGISQALFEEIQYDSDGQLLTGSLLDYSLPLAGQTPDFETAFLETPSPYNPLGAKGVGESGCIGAPPAIVNAVLDALSPLGITDIDMPLKPEKIWKLIQEAQQRRKST